MDYDAIAKAGSMLGSGAVIVMNETRCDGSRACLRPERTSTCTRAAASARLAARARGGCTACHRPHRAMAKVKKEDLDLLEHRWPSISRAAPSAPWAMRQRCRCEGHDQALEGRVRRPDREEREVRCTPARSARPTALIPSRLRWLRDPPVRSGDGSGRIAGRAPDGEAMIEIELDGQKVARSPAGSMVMHAADARSGIYVPALLLSQEAQRSPPTAACAW